MDELGQCENQCLNLFLNQRVRSELPEMLELTFDLVLKLFKLIPTVPSKEMELLEMMDLTCIFSAKVPKE